MPLIRNIILFVVAFVLTTVVLSSCDSLDDERIPPTPVHLAFSTQAQWNLYGVAGAMDYNSFIREKRQPRDFPYPANSYTGFGGILLVGNVMGEPVAYDLACPVERQANIRIFIDDDKLVAECPECHSTYDVFSLPGHPLSGPAVDKGYGLKTYHVAPGRIDYMVISF